MLNTEENHFRIVEGLIRGISVQGNVTATIFQFNRDERVNYMKALIDMQLF